MPKDPKRRTRFAEVMDAKGVRPEEIAHHCRCSVGYIYKLRRGDQRPSLRMAERLAAYLGVSPAIFFDIPPDDASGIARSA